MARKVMNLFSILPPGEPPTASTRPSGKEQFLSASSTPWFGLNASNHFESLPRGGSNPRASLLNLVLLFYININRNLTNTRIYCKLGLFLFFQLSFFFNPIQFLYYSGQLKISTFFFYTLVFCYLFLLENAVITSDFLRFCLTYFDENK